MKKFRVLSLVLSIIMITTLVLTGCTQETAPPPAEEKPAEEKPAEEKPAEEKPAGLELKYPERPINAVVGFSAGGPTDVIARGIVPIPGRRTGCYCSYGKPS